MMGRFSVQFRAQQERRTRADLRVYLTAALVLGSLAIKRAREKPRRKVKIWVCDVAKQM